MKKSMSLLLALMMIFALAVPAFAGNQQLATNQKALDVAGESVAPTITVTMPTGVTLGLNPYKMKYAGATAFFKNEKGSQAQIISPIAVIENKSDCKLSVEATVSATAEGNIVLKSGDAVGNVETTGTKSGDYLKNVYLTVQIGEAKDKTGSGWKAATAPTAAVLVPASANYADANAKKAAADYKAKESDGTARTESATDGKMKPVELDATDGKTANYLGIKFDGKAAEAPTVAWEAADKINVALVFTFNPVVLPVSPS